MKDSEIAQSNLNMLRSVKIGRWLTLAWTSGVFTSGAFAQLKLLPPENVPMVFGGGTRQVRTIWENPTQQPTEVEFSVRLFQASSATAASSGPERPWKKLTVLPGQTVIENTPLDFPAVKAESRFVAQWLDANRKVLGTMQCLVYPQDLLKELATLGGDKPIGVLDPENQLKPLLKALKIEIEDFEERGLEYFDGHLAILGPFTKKDQMPPSLPGTIDQKAQSGVRIVWVQPPRTLRLEPSTQFIHKGHGMIAITDAGTIGTLADNPRAQINLIRLARFAVKPELLTSSSTSHNP